MGKVFRFQPLCKWKVYILMYFLAFFGTEGYEIFLLLNAFKSSHNLYFNQQLLVLTFCNYRFKFQEYTLIKDSFGFSAFSLYCYFFNEKYD